MLINNLLDITNNLYVFNFKHSASEPNFSPILDDVDTKIWVTDEGIIVKGRKICGNVGNSMFRVEGMAINYPLACERIMLCRWKDIEIYNKGKKGYLIDQLNGANVMVNNKEKENHGNQ